MVRMWMFVHPEVSPKYKRLSDMEGVQLHFLTSQYKSDLGGRGAHGVGSELSSLEKADKRVWGCKRVVAGQANALNEGKQWGSEYASRMKPPSVALKMKFEIFPSEALEKTSECGL